MTDAAPAQSVESTPIVIPPPLREALILHLFMGREAGGITSALGQWLPAQREAGWRHLAIQLGPGDAGRELAKFGVDTVVANNGRGLRTLDRFRKLHRDLAAIAPAIVHTHNPLGQSYASIARRRVEFKLVRTVHADASLEMKHALSLPARIFWSTMTRRAMKRTDAVICIHEHVRASLDPGVRERASVSPNGLDPGPIERSTASIPEAFRAWLGSDEVPLILGVGRFVAIKRWPWVIRAFSASNASSRGARLALLGQGPAKRELEALLAELDLEDRVRIEPWAPDIAPYLKRAAFTVIASRSETGPLTLLEAMAASTPSIATRVGLTADTIVDGVTGRLIDHPSSESLSSGDITRLANTIDSMLADPVALRSMGTAARERLRGRFDHRATAAARAVIYNALLGD